MITRDEALKLKHGDEIHSGDCTVHVGPRGGRREYVNRWRVSGRPKTWKSRPDDFQVPIKTGFKGPHGYITPNSAADLHVAADCPITYADECTDECITHAPGCDGYCDHLLSHRNSCLVNGVTK